MKVVILAGGSGERFWPLSTNQTPKQFLKLFSDKSLIRETFDRINYFVSLEDIFVVTNEVYAKQTYNELSELPKENVLLEPLKKNTAAACTFATLKASYGEIVLVVPADHYIPDKEAFWNSVKVGMELLEKQDGIITFGIVPTRPETGYGYIEVDADISENVARVKRFHEKPRYEVAVDYLESGNFFWNSGMFMWKKEYFIDQMMKHAPNVITPFLNSDSIFEIYEKVPSISIDYALMEKADKIFVVKAQFSWSDVGNWKSLEEIGVKNSDRSVVIDGENVFVKSTKPTIVIGVSDIVVVETENGILVADKKDLEKIREGIKKLSV
ncbi:MAG: mannose-1-phosphate guanylyltransferase [Fervidobacterium sp.]|nr:mannose-1-phosphate guanylyltransferase [Fervidobacterium sp.]